VKAGTSAKFAVDGETLTYQTCTDAECADCTEPAPVPTTCQNRNLANERLPESDSAKPFWIAKAGDEPIQNRMFL
jgi:hypothetical protein